MKKLKAIISAVALAATVTGCAYNGADYGTTEPYSTGSSSQGGHHH